jgi:epoxyqueuosine reductase
MVLKHAVAAGLGQMGLNGQILTPWAGSRCRINAITTNAPFEFDAPIDYGINKLCDACQVRRCPSGAIPRRRVPYRGVEKSKLNTARCYPVVAQTNGCAICMKVCPVQRFGLEAMLAEFAATGRVLGKDTDELEGYWFQGTYYRPGERPQLSEEWFHPKGFTFDPNRKLPDRQQ